MTLIGSLSARRALVLGAESLARLQEPRDHDTAVRGEFPMMISGDESRVDFNYLSGYTLLHVALARRCPGLPAEVATTLDGILLAGRDVPGNYQSETGLGNWYSGRGTGLPCPPGFDWPGDQVLCLRDDFDDTAISALLVHLADMRVRTPISARTFDAAILDPGRHRLVPKSKQRIEVAGLADGTGIYQSWALDRTCPDMANVTWVPQENSVELTTVANVRTAVALLGGGSPVAQERSALFVNALARYGIEHLLAGDVAKLDFASGYYPRFPFAPLAFLVHDHHLTGGHLLDAHTTGLLRTAVLDVDPAAYWRVSGFGTQAFWLNCCLWCVRAGIVSADEVRSKVVSVWRDLRVLFDGTYWPDLIFFYGAHVGHYSGRAYSLALMVDSLAMLAEWEI